MLLQFYLTSHLQTSVGFYVHRKTFLASQLLYRIYHALAFIKIFSKRCLVANDISMHVISTWRHNCISKRNCLAVQN